MTASGQAKGVAHQEPSACAIAVLRAMRGCLLGCLDGGAPFAIDPGWSGPVPGEIAQELHDAGLIEIDEDAPIGIPFTFRISAAGRAFLTGLPAAQSAARDD